MLSAQNILYLLVFHPHVIALFFIRRLTVFEGEKEGWTLSLPLTVEAGDRTLQIAVAALLRASDRLGFFPFRVKAGIFGGSS